MNISGPDIAGILTALTAFVSAVASIIAVVRIQVIHKATNSLVTTLLIEGKSAARQEGVTAGIAQGTATGIAQGTATGLAQGTATGLAQGTAAVLAHAIPGLAPGTPDFAAAAPGMPKIITTVTPIAAVTVTPVQKKVDTP